LQFQSAAGFLKLLGIGNANDREPKNICGNRDLTKRLRSGRRHGNQVDCLPEAANAGMRLGMTAGAMMAILQHMIKVQQEALFASTGVLRRVATRRDGTP